MKKSRALLGSRRQPRTENTPTAHPPEAGPEATAGVPPTRSWKNRTLFAGAGLVAMAVALAVLFLPGEKRTEPDMVWVPPG